MNKLETLEHPRCRRECVPASHESRTDRWHFIAPRSDSVIEIALRPGVADSSILRYTPTMGWSAATVGVGLLTRLFSVITTLCPTPRRIIGGRNAYDK